jgi:hypothetical protein
VLDSSSKRSVPGAVATGSVIATTYHATRSLLLPVLTSLRRGLGNPRRGRCGALANDPDPSHVPTDGSINLDHYL